MRDASVPGMDPRRAHRRVTLPRTTCCIAVAVAVALAIPAGAAAQPNKLGRITTESGPGRIECHEHATNAAGLDDRQAVNLCVGARSDAPARCADEAIDRVGLDDPQAVALCRAARSTAPAGCARKLDGLGLEHRELVGYCRALAWPLVGMRRAGVPACVRAGIDRTNLAEQDVVRLCRGSRTTAPIECYEKGDDVTFLSDRDLVTLCRPVKVAAPRALRDRPGR